MILACFGSEKFIDRHLMDLTDNDVPGAVSQISFNLNCEMVYHDTSSLEVGDPVPKSDRPLGLEL